MEYALTTLHQSSEMSIMIKHRQQNCPTVCFIASKVLSVSNVVRVDISLSLQMYITQSEKNMALIIDVMVLLTQDHKTSQYVGQMAFLLEVDKSIKILCTFIK